MDLALSQQNIWILAFSSLNLLNTTLIFHSIVAQLNYSNRCLFIFYLFIFVVVFSCLIHLSVPATTHSVIFAENELGLGEFVKYYDIVLKTI